MLNKIVAILLSFFILLQLVDVGFEQVAKVKTLLEHAAYHNEVYGDSFFDFLVEHYTDESLHTADDHREHENLPFKDPHQCCQHSTNTTYTFNNFNLRIAAPSIATSSNFFYLEPVSVFEPTNIFQPPKYA